MCSKVSLLVVALCALAATPTESQAPGLISVPGETCAPSCGASTDALAWNGDNYLLLINLCDDVSKPLAILLSEVLRGNREDDLHKSVAVIIGLDQSNDLSRDFDVFIAWVEQQPEIVIGDGLIDIVDGKVMGVWNMLDALKTDGVKTKVNKRAMAYYFITWLAAFRTSFAKDAEDVGVADTHADAKLEAALGIPEAIIMHRSLKYFSRGSPDVREFLIRNVSKSDSDVSSESDDSE